MTNWWWYSKVSPDLRLRLIAYAEGDAMVRHPGCMAFIMPLKELLAKYTPQPPKDEHATATVEKPEPET